MFAASAPDRVRPAQVSAGGSLANSIVGVARLGLASTGATQTSPLRVGMLSVAGSDAQVRCSGLYRLATSLKAGH